MFRNRTAASVESLSGISGFSISVGTFLYFAALCSFITYILVVLRRSINGCHRVLISGTRSGVGVNFNKRRRLCCIVAALTFVSPIGLVCGADIECHR